MIFVFQEGQNWSTLLVVPLPQPAQSWVWLVDLERTIALLIGPMSWWHASGFTCVSRRSRTLHHWMKTHFSDGVEMDTPQLGNVLSLPHLWVKYICVYTSFDFSYWVCWIENHDRKQMQHLQGRGSETVTWSPQEKLNPAALYSEKYPWIRSTGLVLLC